MYNVILPMAGNATRIPKELVANVPKHLLPLPSHNTLGNTVLDIAMRPLINALSTEQVRIGAVIPCGTTQRDIWNLAYRQSASYLISSFVDQEIPNGAFGAVLRYLNSRNDPILLTRPTFVVLADTIQDISYTKILSMMQRKVPAWMTTAFNNNVGDVVKIKGSQVAGIVKQEDSERLLMPAGMFYFRNTELLYRILTQLSNDGVSELNVIDVINKYVSLEVRVDWCFIPRFIDCGNIDGYRKAVMLSENKNNNFF